MKKTRKLLSIVLSVLMILATMPFTAMIAQAEDYRSGDNVSCSALRVNDKLYKGSTVTIDDQKYDIKIDDQVVATLEKGSIYTVDKCLRFERTNKGFFTNGSISFHSSCDNFTPATCTEPGKCADCGLVLFSPIGHKWQDATCTQPKKCAFCNEIDGEPLAHDYRLVEKISEPTSEDPYSTYSTKCFRCQKDGNPVKIGNDVATDFLKIKPGTIVSANSNVSFKSDFSTKIRVKVKGTTTEYKSGEIWTPDKCYECKAKYKSGPLGTIVNLTFEEVNIFTYPTCEKPSICIYCGDVINEALGHNWQAATCTAPKTCSVCNKKSGKALGHVYIIDDNGNPVCKRCSALPPEREYTRTTPIDKIRTGELVESGYSMSVSATGRTEIDVYIDGVSRDYYNTSTNVVAPNCLKCTSNTTTQGGSIVIVQFKSNCLYTEPTEDHPATCVYCGKEKPAAKSMTASTISKGNIVIIVAMSLAVVGAMAIFAIIYQKKKKCKAAE